MMTFELNGRWWSWAWTRSPGNRWRTPLGTLLLFGLLDLGFAGLVVGIEVATGHPPQMAHAPSASPSFDDALWHVGTAFLLVLPLRNRLALWIAPVLALGFDVDHIFGTVLPTVDGRSAHDAFFVLMLTTVLYFVLGRSPALVGAGVVVAHLAVDGGTFPWFGPFSTAVYPLPLPLALSLLVLGSAMMALGFRSVREILSPRTLLPIAASCAVIGSVLALVPFVSTWSLS
jgi:hypothetical protein